MCDSFQPFSPGLARGCPPGPTVVTLRCPLATAPFPRLVVAPHPGHGCHVSMPSNAPTAPWRATIQQITKACFPDPLAHASTWRPTHAMASPKQGRRHCAQKPRKPARNPQGPQTHLVFPQLTSPQADAGLRCADQLRGQSSRCSTATPGGPFRWRAPWPGMPRTPPSAPPATGVRG